ncbi:CD99 antigen-like protein 2 isoform X3 [Anguilla anguilla]|uniref:CD99 antigen-like protein 2 isoform X3 n=1 Tax=Anguilla anguilla TaxID=7936 RepID=UPI0015B0C190|nr:CD99 antigen-like protein 2 isoform X3 [Anguilla anguilla]
MLNLWILLFASLAIGAKAQGFDLSDALGGDEKDPTKAPIPKVPVDPKKPGGDGGLDLFDAVHPDPKDPAQPPPKPPAGDGFDLNDALGPDPVTPKKPAVNPPKDGGTDGGTFGDSDLLDVLGGGGYTPDKGKGGGHINNPSSDDGGKGYEDEHKDLALPWTQILKLLSANMPENFHIWITNLKGVVDTLFENVMELIGVTL